MNIDDFPIIYESFLRNNYSAHCKQFKDRLISDIEAAQFEAVMFYIMKQHYGFEIAIEESPGSGGPDFICKKGNYSFILEVTHIDTKTVEKKSGISNIPSNGSGGAYSLLTSKLRKITGEKVPQLANYDMPRVLAIGTFHSAGIIFFSTTAAEEFLTSEAKITISFNSDGNAVNEALTTDLKNSCFFRHSKTDGAIEFCRQSISAILLVSVYYDCANLIGMLNPKPVKPEYEFNYELFQEIPFCKIIECPITTKFINTEWTSSAPEPKIIYFKNISEITTQN